MRKALEAVEQMRRSFAEAIYHLVWLFRCLACLFLFCFPCIGTEAEPDGKYSEALREVECVKSQSLSLDEEQHLNCLLTSPNLSEASANSPEFVGYISLSRICLVLFLL